MSQVLEDIYIVKASVRDLGILLVYWFALILVILTGLRGAFCEWMIKPCPSLFDYSNILWQCEDDKPPMQLYQVSKEKAKSLGINFTPLEVSLRDLVECLKEKGFIKQHERL